MGRFAKWEDVRATKEIGFEEPKSLQRPIELAVNKT